MKPARHLVIALWIAVAMLVALAAFFALVGGAVKSPAFVLITLGAGLAFAAFQLLRYRQRDAIMLTPDARRTRERRGF